MRLIASVLSVLLERRSVMTALALATCRRIRDCGVITLTFSENLGSCRSRSAKLCCIAALNRFRKIVGHPKRHLKLFEDG